MILLDENIPDEQRLLLSSWRIRARQIGFDFGRSGMLDDEIITMLRRRRQCTFFTNDEDFYDRRLRHSHFGLFYLAINKSESASYIRKLLRHPEFDTHEKRMGIVACVTPNRLSVWRLHALQEIYVNW